MSLKIAVQEIAKSFFSGKDFFMKKMISALLAGVIFGGAVSAQSVKLVNIFGGDSDNTGGPDLFTYDRQKNDDGSYITETEFCRIRKDDENIYDFSS